MAAGRQTRDPFDWEWREAEYERRRQRARVVARRRGRLRLGAAALIAAAVIGSGLLVARAVSMPAPHARAETSTVIAEPTSPPSATTPQRGAR